MSSWTTKLPYFSASELACKGTGVIKVDPRFAAALVALRFARGEPMPMLSVCRTPAHNKAIGGHVRSLHLTKNPVHATQGSMAGDMDWTHLSVAEKREFCRLAWKMGFSLGLKDVSIHFDYRIAVGLPQTIYEYEGQWSLPITEAQIRGG